MGMDDGQTSGLELARRWFRESWTEEREEAVESMLAPDCIAHGLGPEPMVGHAAFKAWRAAVLEQFEVKARVLQGVSEGDRVAVQCEARMTHRATGRSGTFTGACFMTVEDGLVTESTNEWNFAALLEQLGVAPEGGLGRLLTEPHPELPRWA